MYRKYIEQLAAEPDRAVNRLWRYQRSGNTVELYTKAQHEEDPESYRQGVLQIGRLLQAVEHEVTEHSAILHIQSFPDLNESRLAALIRLHPYSGHYRVTQKKKQNGLVTGQPRQKSLAALASQYGFAIHDSSTLSAGLQKKVEEYAIQPNVGESRSMLFLLGTTMDNPFIWLKVGRWIERFQLMNQQAGETKSPTIVTQLSGEERALLASDLVASRFIQLLYT